MALNPSKLRADLVGEVFLKILGKDAPGVGFDLEMRAGLGVFREVGQGGLGVVQGRGEGLQRFGVEWDMKVDAALGPRIKFQVFSFKARKKIREILEANEGFAGFDDDLMEVGRLVEGADGLEGSGVAWVE
jgi:hypothetical protein